MDRFDVAIDGGIIPKDQVEDCWTSIFKKLHKVLAQGTVSPELDFRMDDFDKMNEIRARCDEEVTDKKAANSLNPVMWVVCGRIERCWKAGERGMSWRVRS